MPAASHATKRAHGTRTKYAHDGCRCFACRCANSDYETARQARRREGMVWQIRYAPPTRQYVVRNAETGEIVRRTYERDEAIRDRDHRNKEALRALAPAPLWASGLMVRKFRERILSLQAMGSGINQLARTCGISRTRITEIVNGTRYSKDRPSKGRIKLATVRRVLDSTISIASGARVSGLETNRMIKEILASGMRKYELARRLGSAARIPALQIKQEQVLQSTEDRVRLVHDQIWREQPEFRKFCRCPWWEV